MHKKAKKESFWKKVSPDTNPKKLILFVMIFASFGGVWLVYQSFAYCGENDWSGSCQAIVNNMTVKLDTNNKILNYHKDASGSLVLSDLGAQKRTQAVWQLEKDQIWQSASFAFADNPGRRRVACVELVNLGPEGEELVIDIALKDNSKEGEQALVGLVRRQGPLAKQTVTSVCSEIVEGLPNLEENPDNWSIQLTNLSGGPVGLFRDYVLLEQKVE